MNILWWLLIYWKCMCLCACVCKLYCSNQDTKNFHSVYLVVSLKFPFTYRSLSLSFFFFQFVYWKSLAICHNFPQFSDCLSMISYDMSFCSYIAYILVVRFWGLIWLRFDFLARILQRTHCILPSGYALYLAFSISYDSSDYWYSLSTLFP